MNREASQQTRPGPVLSQPVRWPAGSANTPLVRPDADLTHDFFVEWQQPDELEQPLRPPTR